MSRTAAGRVPGVAVVGAGHWGQNLVRVFAELEALRLVCEVDAEKRSRCAASCPGVRVTERFTDVLSDADVSAVVIATPAASHHRLAREALAAGKDVFVEKPLALTAADGRDLVRAAQDRNRLLMVGHLLEYHPAVVALKALVDRGDLGKIQYLYSHRLNLGKFRTEENILWSFAPHDVSVMRLLLEETPVEVSAHGASYLHQAVADVTVTTMKFASGVRAHLFVSWLHPYKDQRLVVVADRKMAVFNDTAEQDKLVLYSHEIDWVKRVPVPHRKAGEVVPLEPAEPLRLECRHFLDCLQTRRTPQTDGASGVRVLEILEACQASLERDGQPVRLTHAD